MHSRTPVSVGTQAILVSENVCVHIHAHAHECLYMYVHKDVWWIEDNLGSAILMNMIYFFETQYLTDLKLIY